MSLACDLLPGFTFLLPTYNSEGRLRRCLESIRRQDYPQDMVQIVVADGGSTDRTVEIAETYGVTVVPNPLRLAEEGLRAGMPHVTREYVVIFADDNELAENNWLSTAESIFADDPCVCAFFCRLGASADDPEVNKYYALVESEPLNFYMNRNLKDYIDRSGVQEQGGVRYCIFDVNPSKPLVWGANGLTYRTAAIKPIWETDRYLGDTDAFQTMIEAGNNRVAYTRELCVYHHHVNGIFAWRQKWGRNFQQHFLTNVDTRNLNWLFVPHFNLRLAVWTLYSLVPVVSVPVAIARAVRDRDWHWLYHPAAAFLQATTYIKILLSTPKGREYLREWFRRSSRCDPSPSTGDGGRPASSAPRLEGKELAEALERFRAIADISTGDDPLITMDWASALWLDGTRRCVNMTGEYLQAGTGVLDYGCGLGLVPVLLRAMGFEVKGVDIDAGGQPEVASEASGAPWASLEGERENPHMMTELWSRLSAEFGIDFEVYDGKRIPAEDGAFDAVVAHGVLEHVNPELLPRSLEEIRRVLKGSGLLFIFRTPRKKAYLERLAGLLGLGTHERTYDECDVVAMVECAGFATVRVDFSDMLPSFLPVGMGVYNRLSPVMSRIDKLLLRTPLRRYSHHMALVFRSV